MRNKKAAVELSLNFIVVLIISIVLFGFGVIFIRNLFSQATDLKDLTLEELDERIADLICEGTDRVCIPIESKTISRNEHAIFGIRILNVLIPEGEESGQSFTVEIKNPSELGYLGYEKDGDPIGTNFPLIIYPDHRTIFIKQNEEAKIGIGIQVPKEAVSGRYIFNVDVKADTDNDEDLDSYSSLLKLYVDVP